MSDVVQLGAARAKKTGYASEISPRDMLLRVIEAMDSGELRADHFIVISGRVDEDMTTYTQIDQAGPFDRFRQVGLVNKGLKMLERL